MELPKELTGRLYSERGAVVHSEVNSVIKTDHGKFFSHEQLQKMQQLQFLRSALGL